MALEALLAGALIVLPFVLGLGPAAVVTGLAAGALLAGIAISGHEPGSRGALPLSAHAIYDWAIGVALVCLSIPLGFAGGTVALLLFLAAGAAELTLHATTRYTSRRI